MEEKKKNEEEHRKHYRIPISIPIRYEKVDIKKSFLSPDKLSLEGTILDIGGGGIKIRTEEEIKEGDYLELKMLLSIIPEHYHFFGQVRWVKEDVSRPDKPGHTGGVYFVEISKKLQNQLIRKINKIRKIRKEGFL